MAKPAYMKIEGIDGSFTGVGREGTIEILAFDHEVYLPIDRDDGKITGTRKHEPIIVHKAFDKASALLYKMVCTGETIPSIKIDWYRTDESGKEVIYFTHELTNCRIASVKPYMINIKEKDKEQYDHQESVTIRYEKINWTFAEGNLMHEDEWTVR